MKKFFDYKFILLLCLSLIVYFLHREIEFVNKRLHKIEKNFNNLLDYKPNHNILNEKFNVEDLNTTYDLQLPLPTVNLTEPINYDNIQENTDDIDSIEKEVLEEEVIDSDDSEELSNINSSELNINLENIETMSDNNLEEFSNELTDNVQIYSNDNEEENHTSVMESLEDMTKNIEVNYDVDTLLKNKLKELQEIAKTLNISITREGSNKKKTKLQLAQDIISKKKISKI